MRKSRSLPRLLLPATAGLLGACLDPALNPAGPPQASPQRPAEPARARPLPLHVLHADRDRGAPTVAWIGGRLALPPATTAADAARLALRHIATGYRVSPAAVASARLRTVHDTGQGVLVAQFDQRVDDLEVFQGGLNIALDRSLQPVAVTGALARATRPRSRDFGPAAAAVATAYRQMTGRDLDAAGVGAGTEEAGGYTGFTLPAGADADGRLLKGNARTKRVWFPQLGGLLPATYVELEVGAAADTDSALEAFVVSASGEVLFRHDLTAADAFSYRVWADKDGRFAPWDSPHGTDFTPHPTATRDGKEPTLKAPNLVTLQNLPFSKNDPWLPADATETRGNNVWAYADIVGPSGFNAGDLWATTTGPKTFDRTYDPMTPPQGTEDSRRAVTTNLFYVLNYLHDYFYDAGWDEKSFNAQQDNYGRGGTGGDPLLAEAQDYSGRNNANASTPADGRSPRIQMYLWNGGSRRLTVRSPADLAGDYTATIASFGPDTFRLAGDAVVVDDGAGTAADGCESPFMNAAAVNGNIAIIERGTCSFGQKVYNAERNGAKGVIIVNNAVGLPPDPMGGTPPMPVSIPTLGISQEDGAKIRAKLMAGTPVSLSLSAARLDRDGSLDATIVSHEWGHVLSNRLVGNGTGLNSLQGGGMGEGWSDFLSLLTIVRPEDKMAPGGGLDGTYAVGAHAGGGANGFYDGIRRYPYSTDKSKNPLTFKHIQNGVALPAMPAPRFGADGASNAEVHNTGEVWASMLWECYVALLKDSRYTFEQANRRMRDYLVAGLKLTPRAPTILEARDAMLAAMYATEPKDHRLCWEAFAKRGAGVGATGPDRFSRDNSPVTESFSVGNDLQFVAAALDDSGKSCDMDGVLDNDEVGVLTVTIRNTGAGPISTASVTAATDSPGVTFPDGPTVSFAKADPYQTGTAKLKVALRGAPPQGMLQLSLELKDPQLAVPRTIKATQSFATNYDDVPASSTTDKVDDRNSVWSAAGDMMLDGSQVWQRVFDGPNGMWHITANEAPSDQYLVSPPLAVSMTDPLRIKFRHRHRFEAQLGEYQDGGVIEISTDGGKTWRDIGDRLLQGGGYGGTIYRDNPVLAGRRAFIGTSRGYPMDWVESEADLGVAYKGQMVQLRFRVGTDEGTGANGWDVDEIAFSGITNKPFSARGADRGMCANRPPTANAGQDQSVAPGSQVTLMGSGSDPDGDPLTYRWTQTAGPMVTLDDAAVAQAGFRAPDATEPTVLTFSLVVSDGKVESAPATVSITVDPQQIGPDPDPMDGQGCGCRVGGQGGGAPATLGGLLIALGALLRRRRR